MEKNKEIGHKIKINGYSQKNRTVRKEKRRDEAEKRELVYSLLSKKEKIEKAERQRGNSKKQLTKLEKQCKLSAKI